MDHSLSSHSFRPGPGFWQVRLLGAHTAEEVLWVVKDFIAGWSPEEIRCLPRDCRPGKVRDAEDVGLYAFQLVNAQFESSVEQAQLDRMAGFMTAAASRLSQLLATSANDATSN